jgi:uncharacterized membrane protein
MRNLTHTEPVAVAAAVQAALVSVIGLLAAFGVWSPTEEQVGALLTVYVALVAVVAAIVRARVSPVPWDEDESEDAS